MNGISALLKRGNREMIFLTPSENTMRRWLSTNQKTEPHQTLNLPEP